MELVDEKLTKIPYNPHTGYKANPIDPATWSDYQTAVHAASNGNGYSGIGFVLTENDPYCIIDLDDPKGNPQIIERQRRIEEAFDSYSEVSPSGNGLHIIVKAAVHSWRLRNKVEITSSKRYFTMTGLTYHDKPIAERNQLANMLWDELGENNGGNNVDVKVISQPEKYTDEMIYTLASQADNGTKFLDLWQGKWQQYYNDTDRTKISCNEADFALINILGFYSRNVNQIRRMFLMSELGKRDKAKRKAYVDNMIIRSFDKLPPLMDVEEIILNAAKDLAKKRSTATIEEDLKINPWNRDTLFADQPDLNYDWTRPPGLLGDISSFIYEAAPRPVKEIALAAAIGLMSGICGRCYNVSNTGLNTYILMIAKTGIGKEAAHSGIERLVNAIKLRPSKQLPAIGEFIGPSEVSSGPALIRYINKHPSFISIVGEFGLMLASMHSQGATPAQSSLKRKLLELYTKSGDKDVYRPSVYADDAKSIPETKSPNFCLLGESTPETFYRTLDESIITEGLLPRFVHIEYLGNRPAPNDDASRAEPNEKLIDDLGNLAAGSIMLAQNSRCVTVAIDQFEGAPKEVEDYHKAFRSACDDRINASDQIVSRELWSRAHLKVLKLAAIIAIGENPHTPVLSVQGLEWSIKLVERGIYQILSKFESGKAGKETGELNQLSQLVDCMSSYIRKSFTNFKGYKIDEAMYKDGVVPVSYLQRRLLGQKSFKEDKTTASNALNRAIRALLDDGSIREVHSGEMQSRYKTSAKAYLVVKPERF